MFVFPPEIDTSSGVPDEKPPASLSDVFQSTMDADWKAYGLMAKDHAMEAAADRRNDEIFKATGERLENPMRVYADTGTIDVPRSIVDPSSVSLWQEKLLDLQTRYPQHAGVIRADVPLLTDAGEVSRNAAAGAQNVWERAPAGFGKWAAWGAASLASAALDPVNQTLGLLVPGGRAAEGAAGVAWAALKTGAANAGLVAVEQPFMQAWRKKAGLDYGVMSAVEETAAGFLFGAVLEGGVRGTYRGVQTLRGREAIVENGVVTGYRTPDAGAVASPPARAGNPLDALDIAASEAHEGSVLRRAQAGDIEAIKTIAEKTGLHEDPAVRGAIDALEQDLAVGKPPEGVAPVEHVTRLNDAIKAADDPRALPHGEALVAAHAETADPARISEVLNGDPLDLAVEIRDNPAMLQEGLPWQDPKLKAAANLSRLSDQAFDMVAGGEAPPVAGVIVAEHVTNPDLHVGLMRQLVESDAKTPAEMRARLADLMAGPRDAETHARVAGVADDLVGRPVTLVDDPHGPAATRQLEQLRALHAAEIEVATGKAPAAGDGVSPAATEKAPPASPSRAIANNRLVEALDAAIGRLPEGIKVKSFADISDLPKAMQRGVLAARSARRRVDGMTERDTGNIWIAHDAFDPEATLSHETVHALRQTGVLNDAELKLLADKAAQFPDLFDRAAYAELYRDLPNFDDVMLQEAAAHLYEARANGANFGKDANAILRKIRQFLERVKNKLNGLGWQTADDVMRAIDDGTIAARARRPVEMPGGGQVEGVPLYSIKAYHGTPHEVDRFSSEKIGTGEGAQAFGYGLYFAESEAVARQYRDKLSTRKGFPDIMVDGVRTSVGDNETKLWLTEQLYYDQKNLRGATDGNRVFAGDILDHYKELFENDGALVGGDGWDHLTTPDAAEVQEVIGFIDSLYHRKVEFPQQGRLYQVEIAAEPEHFLDWDKPLSEQPPSARSAMQSILKKIEQEGDLEKEYPSGADFVDDMQDLLSPERFTKMMAEAGITGVRYLDGSSRGKGEGTYNYVVFDDSKIKITHVDGQPVTDPADTGGALFSLRDDARAQLKADLEEAATIADAKAKAQRERQALIDETIRAKNERFVTTLRDARGQVDPAKALVYMIENHGQVDLPAGMTSVVAEQKAVEAMAKASMEDVMHAFRPTVATGKTRQTARLTNVVRELSGEGTGDDAAKGFATAWMRTAERLRQEFNAAGGDIAKLEGWFLPQVHDRAALLAAGEQKWVAETYNLLDLNRILDGTTRQPLSPAEIRAALSDIWQNITSDGHGTQAANAADPFGGIKADAGGAKKLANQRQEHRFLHYKSADAWLDYQKQYGGGADPFRAMMQHISGMAKDIAAMRVLGTNPDRELARLARFAMKQASLARPAAVIIDELVAKAKGLSEDLLTAPTRLNEVSDRIGAIHKDIARLREKRVGPPSKRSKAKISALQQELFALDAERISLVNDGAARMPDGLEAARIRADLMQALDELTAAQDVDKVLFPKKTEMLGRAMTRTNRFWTTMPEDYARAHINRAEAMWDLYRGTTSAPVNAKAAEHMQTLRNIGVIGRGGSMVISSIADNFVQMMARSFTGLPIARTLTDIVKELGPASRRDAQRAALIGEEYLHMFNDGARGASGQHGAEWSHYLAERTISLQGLNALTNAQRRAFGMTLQGTFADLAAKSWAEIAELNPRLQKVLVRYGLDQSDWDAIRLDPVTRQPREVDFLSPNLVRDSLEAHDPTNAARRVAERYLGMILQETDFASPTSMLRARAMIVGKNRPGTFVGEVARSAGQFKLFPVMFWMLHAERAMREAITKGGLKGASYAAQLLAVTTLGGALVVQLKDLKGGKEPRPMNSKGFWYAAMLQGGGLGIVGDLFNAEQNRFGGGLVSTVSGPVVGLAEDVIGAAGLSPKTTARRGTARLLTSYVPGSSLWYANLAWQRIVADNLQRQLDPDAHAAFRRKQQQQKKDYGNGFWWAPGDAGPRPPRLN